VKVDANRLKQIIINLISNAIKYTQKGYVKVISRIKDDQISICVHDTGTGIESAKLGQIFTAFAKIMENRELN
jgi:signal transduction histidine kinase